MESFPKPLYVITLANVIVAVALACAVHFPRLAFDLRFSGAGIWAFFLLAPAGIALSIMGFRFAGQTPRVIARGISYAINSSALALNASVVVGTFYLFLSITDKGIIIPEGYSGTIYIFYDVKAGKAVDKTFRNMTLPIPYDGILWVRDPMFTGWTRTTYFYSWPGGILQRLSGSWPDGTRQMNDILQSDNQIGVFFPRAGGLTINGCTAEFEQFTVGTRAELSAHHEDDETLPAYLRSHPEVCVNSSKVGSR